MLLTVGTPRNVWPILFAATAYPGAACATRVLRQSSIDGFLKQNSSPHNEEEKEQEEEGDEEED